MYMEVLHPCIWRFYKYMESNPCILWRNFFFQDGVSRVWHDLARSRMSGFFLIPEVRSTEATLVQHPCSRRSRCTSAATARRISWRRDKRKVM